MDIASPFRRIPRWSVLARLAILVMILPEMARVTWGLPEYYKRLLALEPNPGLPGWTQAEMQGMLHSLDLSPHLLAGFLFAASLFCLLSFWAVSGLLFWLKGGSWVGLLSAFVLSGIGVGFSFMIADTSQLPGWVKAWFNLRVVLLWPTFFMLLYLFPDGRFTPRWARFLVPLPYLLFLIALWAGEKFVAPGWMIFLLLAFVVGGVASQIYRYLKVSRPEQRQQTKWVIFALCVWAPVLLSGVIIPLLAPALSGKTQTHFLFDVLFTYILGALAAALLPLSIGISIFRYRLWDIDLIIRRTLVYAGLTLLLGLLYFGLVTLLQTALSSLTGQHSPAIIVLSTLAIAALFNPLRRQLQAGVDRLFYRRKYSVELALADFSETARSETDPDLLTRRLVATIEETIQPERINLWLSSRLNAAGEQQIEAINSLTTSPVYIKKETSS